MNIGYTREYNNNNYHIERHNSRFLQSPHCAANCLQHVSSSGPGTIVCKSRATHRALITSNLQCATWYEGTAQLLSLTVEIAFILALLYRLKPLTDEGGEETGVPEENP